MFEKLIGVGGVGHPSNSNVIKHSIDDSHVISLEPFILTEKSPSIQEKTIELITFLTTKPLVFFFGQTENTKTLIYKFKIPNQHIVFDFFIYSKKAPLFFCTPITLPPLCFVIEQVFFLPHKIWIVFTLWKQAPF